MTSILPVRKGDSYISATTPSSGSETHRFDVLGENLGSGPLFEKPVTLQPPESNNGVMATSGLLHIQLDQSKTSNQHSSLQAGLVVGGSPLYIVGASAQYLPGLPDYNVPYQDALLPIPKGSNYILNPTGINTNLSLTWYPLNSLLDVSFYSTPQEINTWIQATSNGFLVLLCTGVHQSDNEPFLQQSASILLNREPIDNGAISFSTSVDLYGSNQFISNSSISIPISENQYFKVENPTMKPVVTAYWFPISAPWIK